MLGHTVRGFFISTDNGDNWTALSSLPVKYIATLTLYGSSLFAIDVDSGAIYFSFDYGKSWSRTDVGDSNVALRVAVKNSSWFVGVRDGGVFRSMDSGKSWVEVNKGLPKSTVAAFAVNGTNVFAGTGDGVFLSSDNGESWKSVNEGLLNEDIRSLAISDAFVFAGTLFGGVWRRPLSEMITSVEEIGIPQRFSLAQNYPNPFDTKTSISFSIPTQSYVVVKVFDVLGNEIVTLASEEFSPGVYVKEWDAAGFPGGVYFYRLQAGEFVATKSLVLIK